MKLIKLHLLVAAMIIVTSGCVGSGKKYKQQENSAAGVVDSKNKYCYGTYEGILPCADCGGIKTTLKINSDATYDLRSEYLGEENGVYNMIGENIIELVTPSSGAKTYYKVLDDAVVLSDSTEIFNNSGRLAAQYILKRQ